MKQIKWVYKYKMKISAILIVALFIQPFVYLPNSKSIQVNTSLAQTQRMSSTFYNDSSNFSGVSQWGDSQFINNPDIAQALKSCTNVVPSFQNKIVGLFSKKKKLNSSPIASSTVRSKVNFNNNCAVNNIDKFIAGNPAGVTSSKRSLMTQEEIDACDSSKMSSDAAKDFANEQPIKVTDDEANKKLDDLLNLSITTDSAVNDTKNAVEGDKVRNECMDSIAFAMTKQALAGLTESTVNWIETGNWDDPYYIKEPTQFFNSLREQTLKQTLGNLYDRSLENLAQRGENTDYPFLRSTYKGLLSNYEGRDFEQASKSTLADVLLRVNGSSVSNLLINNNNNKTQAVNNFKNDFTQGGWEGWLALTQNPANNPAGFAILANEELNKKVSEKEQEINNQLNRGDGFLSQTKCVEEYISESCSEYTDDQGKTYKSDDPLLATLPAGSTNCSKVAPGYINTRGVTAKPTDINCRQTQVVTPGSIIAERMKFVATTDIRQLELADQFNESLGAVFTAAFNRLQTQGLASLSKDQYGDWESQARRQSFLESYNSQYSTTGNTGKVEPKQLIVRREATGYSSYDFDITTDLFDQQIGCTTNPGIVTIQENYIKELESSLITKPTTNPKTWTDGPLLKILPAMSELDYCIPGPTSNWEDLADERFYGLYNTLLDNPIPYVRKTDNPDFSTYYSSIGKKVSELKLEEERTQKNNNTANAVSGLVGLAASICAASCATGYGAIIAGGVIIAAGIVKLVSSNKAKKAQRESEQFNSAQEEFKESALWAFENEAVMWTDEQITNLVEDYNLFKKEVYTKFSDDNSIPVAKEARPFINSLNDYAVNSRELLTDYETEIKNAKKDLEELKKIQTEVQKIKDAATKEAIRLGLPTDVPDVCKPKIAQCPVKPNTGTTNIISSNLPAYINSGAGVIGLSNGFVNQASGSSLGLGSGASSVFGIAVYGEPEIFTIKPSFDPSGPTTTINFTSSSNTLSALATCSNGLTDTLGRDYYKTEVYGGSFEIDGKPNVGMDCVITGYGPDGLGGILSSNPTQCTFASRSSSSDLICDVTKLSSSGSGTGTSSGGASSLTPEITDFSSNYKTIVQGQKVEISWKTVNSTMTTVRTSTSSTNLNKDIKKQIDSVVVSPARTTTYILTVRNGTQVKTAQIKIVVN